VSVRPDTTVINTIVTGTAGGGGLSNRTAGTVGSLNTANLGLVSLGVAVFPGGFAGAAVSAAGGVNTGGNGDSISVGYIKSGGAGGGGSSTTNVNGNGGSITATNTLYPSILGGTGGGTNNGGKGLDMILNDNITNRLVLQSTGGSGGGANGAGVGGNGGDGGLASGGGGGGAGTIGGSGGKGGDGFVIISSF
jgi:hypothetical protein